MGRIRTYCLICVLDLAAVLGFPLAVNAQNTSAVERVYYWNGASKIELELALDELLLRPNQKRYPGISEHDVPSGMKVLLLGLDGGLLVHLDAQNDAVRGLNVAAQTARGRGFNTDAVLYAGERSKRDVANRRVLGNTLSARLKNEDDLPSIVAHYDLEVIEKVSYSPNTYVFRSNSDDLLNALIVANTLYENGEVEFAVPLLRKQQFPRAAPNDPMFGQQWHLQNTAQHAGAVAGNDVNIVDAWDTVTGAGINIAVTDSGVEVAHPDLAQNARTDIDLDINDNDLDPTPSSSSHGTSAAGIAAAVGNNTIGVAGSGYEAGIVGIRLIEAATNDLQEAQALGHQVAPASANDRVHINTNSWGPIDDAARLETMGPLTMAAVENGIANGRGGLGIIYVWAAGNGRESTDNVNYDGYASSRYTIAVGASGGNGTYSYYSEEGASMLVTAPSSYTSAGTTTTEFSSTYTSSFGGTSSACPLVAGIVSLILEANANLTWRDVQHILVNTAQKIDDSNLLANWQTNGAGFEFSHSYGFGRVDATAAVVAASTWNNKPPETTPVSNSENAVVVIPDNDATGISRTLPISASPDFVTEFVEVTFNASHTWRGDLQVILTSPDGTESTLAKLHSNDSSNDYSNWLFTSVAHWGENPSGDWTLQVSDLAEMDTGSLTEWSLEIHGYLPTLGDDVFVDFSNEGTEDGTSLYPYNTLQEGLAAVSDSGTIHIASGSTSETPTVSQSVTLQLYGGGIVTLGSLP